MEKTYEGFKYFDAVVSNVNYATHGDGAHHVWLSLCNAVGALAGSCTFKYSDYEKLLAGFITQDEKDGIFELLQVSWLEADVRQLLAALPSDARQDVREFFYKQFELNV